MEIKIEHQPSQLQLNELGVFKWEIWQKEVLKFPWTYDSQETCYFLTGDVTVTPDGGQPVQMGEGEKSDFSCWYVLYMGNYPQCKKALLL